MRRGEREGRGKREEKTDREGGGGEDEEGERGD